MLIVVVVLGGIGWMTARRSMMGDVRTDSAQITVDSSASGSYSGTKPADLKPGQQGTTESPPTGEAEPDIKEIRPLNESSSP